MSSSNETLEYAIFYTKGGKVIQIKAYTNSINTTTNSRFEEGKKKVTVSRKPLTAYEYRGQK